MPPPRSAHPFIGFYQLLFNNGKILFDLSLCMYISFLFIAVMSSILNVDPCFVFSRYFSINLKELRHFKAYFPIGTLFIITSFL